MAVCTGITYDSVNDRITIDFVGGDVHGDSFDSPYTFQDVYDTDQDNGWGVFTKNGDVYFTDASIRIEGADTYFKDSHFGLNFHGSFTEYWATWFSFNPHIIIDDFNIVDYTSSLQLRFYTDDFTCTNGNFNNFDRFVTRGGSFKYITLLRDKTVVTTPGVSQFSEIALIQCNLQSRGAANIMKNVNIYNEGDEAINAGWADAIDMKKVNIVDCGKSYSLTIRDNTTSFIDSKVDIDSYETNYYDHTYADFILKSTLRVDIENGDGGTATLYDKNGNQVAQNTNLSGAWDLTDPVTFAKRRLESSDQATVTSDVKTVYEPFKLVVEKSGYKSLEIPNIYCTIDGQGTVDTVVVEEKLTPNRFREKRSRS